MANRKKSNGKRKADEVQDNHPEDQEHDEEEEEEVQQTSPPAAKKQRVAGQGKEKEKPRIIKSLDEFKEYVKSVFTTKKTGKGAEVTMNSFYIELRGKFKSVSLKDTVSGKQKKSKLPLYKFNIQLNRESHEMVSLLDETARGFLEPEEEGNKVRYFSLLPGGDYGSKIFLTKINLPRFIRIGDKDVDSKVPEKTTLKNMNDNMHNGCRLVLRFDAINTWESNEKKDGKENPNYEFGNSLKYNLNNIHIEKTKPDDEDFDEDDTDEGCLL